MNRVKTVVKNAGLDPACVRMHIFSYVISKRGRGGRPKREIPDTQDPRPRTRDPDLGISSVVLTMM